MKKMNAILEMLALAALLTACGKSDPASVQGPGVTGGPGSKQEQQEPGVTKGPDSQQEPGVTKGPDSQQGPGVTKGPDSQQELPGVTKSNDWKRLYGTIRLYALEELDTFSPDGRIAAHFWQDESDSLYYSVVSDKEEVIAPSKLGMMFVGGSFSGGITGITTQQSPEHIEQKYETCLTVSLDDVECVDNCMERDIYLKKGDAKLTLAVRLYNDGFAFRYKDVDLGTDGPLTVLSEESQINLPEDATTFAGGYSATYEFDYNKRSYAELKQHGGVFNTPLTANTGGRWLLFSESDVYAEKVSYCKSVLETKGGSAALSWKFGFRRDPEKEVYDDLSSPGHIRITRVETDNGFMTPWRVAIIADDLNGLINSPVIDSLCPAMDQELFADTSWIQPGKVAWSWWSGGDQHNYDVQVQHVDFAAKYGWEYCCLDAGWPTFENRIEELCTYARDKGVGIILWVNYLKLKTPEDIEKLFSQWSKWGVVGVKTDYFESDDIEVLESMHNVAEIGAKYRLMVYYHGCINPCGETRTYPNIMSSEAVLGEEFRKWSTAPEPENCLMYPFTRNITGSMDYTPACIAITKTGESAGFSLAKAVVYESAFQHFASSAYSFPSFLGLPFLSKIPTAWSTTKLIDGYPGEHITMMRSDGKDYYIGCMTLKKRDVSIALDFLGEGSYHAYLYADDENGKLVLRESQVTAADTLELLLMDIGGAAVLITKEELDTEVETPETDREGFTYYECEDGVLSGEARIADAGMCSGGKKVGYIGNGAGNAVELTVEVEEDGTYELLLYYCTGESRNLTVTVGGESSVLKNLTGRGFDMPVETSVEVTLKKGKNTITLGGTGGYAPDVDRIAIGREE